MKQLSSNLHTKNTGFKKQFLKISLSLFFILPACINVNAQCAVNPVANQFLCNNTATTAINFTGTATTFNWVNNTASIGLAASGTGNIASFTALNTSAVAVTATITVTPSSGACTGTPISFTITVNPSPVVNVTPATSCGGLQGIGIFPCNPLTATGNADSYVWSPLPGLYTNCQATIAYSGTNTTSVYPSPTVNTTYTVTGTISSTGCTNAATALVNYTPPPPVIMPSAVSMCIGDPAVKLRVASGTGVAQFCSGNVNVAVPDNNPAGAFSSINTTGLSPLCTLNSLSVTVNMQHTRIGDMVFVLKAPNGLVMNLDYFISGTGANTPSAGFTGTVFSQLGTNALSTGTTPYTATFKADLINTGALGPAGPTGMLPTATSWASSLSVPVGVWTLGFYDGVTGEVGTLNSWCLNFNTSCPAAPAGPATWSPIAGLYRDPFNVIPYVGDAVDSVWVRPLPAGVYNYQVGTTGVPPGSPICTSTLRSVVVTVGQAVTIVQQPANQTLCGGVVAVFTAGVTGTGPIGYQWQVSPNGGSTYANIANGGPYSGVNTATLTINPATIGMNGYLYRVSINGGTGCSGATSSSALLTVGVLPTIVITANPLTIGPGQTSTISSTVTPNAAANYTWYYNGSVLPGATADTLLVDINGLGDYQLKVTDVNGCTNVSNFVTIAHSFAGTLYTYPNPSAGRFEVRYFSEANSTSQRSLIVYNNRGDRIITKNFTQTVPYQKIEVDVRANGTGIYWIELRDAAGKRLALNRAVVQ